MGSSLSKSHLHRNYWPEETGQVTAPESVADVNGEPGDMASKPIPRKRAKAVKKRPSSPPLMAIMQDGTLRP